MTMFVTYVAKVIPADMPVAWKPFISFKSGNVIAFIDNLMNSYIYGDRFDEISKMVYDSLKADAEFRSSLWKLLYPVVSSQELTNF